MARDDNLIGLARYEFPGPKETFQLRSGGSFNRVGHGGAFCPEHEDIVQRTPLVPDLLVVQDVAVDPKVKDEPDGV